MGTIRYKEHFKCVKTNNNLGYISNIHKDCFHCHQYSKTNTTFQKLSPVLMLYSATFCNVPYIEFLLLLLWYNSLIQALTTWAVLFSLTNVVWGFTTWVLFTGIGSWAPSPNLQPEEPGYLSNWQLAGNQSGMGDPTSCYAAVGVAFTFSDGCKPTHPAKICLQYGGGIMKGYTSCTIC